MDLSHVLLQALLPIIFLIFFKILLSNCISLQSSKLKLPPGPWQLPIIGSIHHLLGDLPHRRLIHLATLHGPLFSLKLGEINYIIASSSSVAQEILRTHDLKFAFRPSIMAIKIIAYNCSGMAFSPHGPYWQQLRKICSTEVLNIKRVKSFVSIREEEIARVVCDIHERGEPRVVNLTEVFLQLMNNHLARAAFGKECKSKERFLKAMKALLRLAPLISLIDLFPSMEFVISRVDGKMKEMKMLHDEMDQILDEIIEEHSRVSGEEMEEDLLGVFLRVRQNKDLEIPLDIIHIKAVILDMLVAATETTANTMVWVISELIRQPELLHKTQSEIRKSIKGNLKFSEEDINHCQHLKNAIKETLRLHPPLPFLLPRTCHENVELLGFKVLSQTRVLINVYAIGRDPNVWENAESFCPDRFNRNDVNFKGGSFECIPFGGGRRICPGMAFSMAGIEFFLSEILLHFDWKLPNGMALEELDMEEAFDGTLRKKNDLCLLATPYYPLEI